MVDEERIERKDGKTCMGDGGVLMLNYWWLAYYCKKLWQKPPLVLPKGLVKKKGDRSGVKNPEIKRLFALFFSCSSFIAFIWCLVLFPEIMKYYGNGVCQ